MGVWCTGVSGWGVCVFVCAEKLLIVLLVLDLLGICGVIKIKTFFVLYCLFYILVTPLEDEITFFGSNSSKFRY